MKVAISSKGKFLDCKVAPKFNKASDLIIYDLEKRSFSVKELKNKGKLDSVSTDHINYLLDNRVKSLITCRCDNEDFKILKEAGIKIYLGAEGSVRTLIEKYKNNKLKEFDGNNVQN